MAVYRELRGFLLHHRRYGVRWGRRGADGDRLWIACPCGARFERFGEGARWRIENVPAEHLKHGLTRIGSSKLFAYSCRNERTEREIEIAGYPDVDDSGPVLTRWCDALLRAPGWAWAVEHTSLDSFGDQRGVAARFHRVIAPLEARLTGRVDHYIELAVDPKAIATGADWTAWTDAIGEAVVAGVPAMPIDEWGTLRVPGVPFEIGVRTEENASIGEVRVIQMAPADLEGERSEVIREAISGKVGVLAPYKAHGYRTVLVLECDDLMLGSRRRIADAFRPLAAACGTAIDDVYLVETRTSPWAVSWLKLGDWITLHPEPVWPTAPGWPFRLR